MDKVIKTAKALLSSKRRIFVGTKVTFLPFFGRIGDAAMFLDALEEYKRLYSASEGYSLVVACRGEVLMLLKALGLDDGLVLVDVVREKLVADDAYLEECVRTVCAYKPDTVVHVREYHACEDLFLGRIPAKTRVSYSSYQRHMSLIRRFLAESAYDRRLFSSVGEDQITCYASLLRYLGRTDYKSKIYRFPEFPRYDGCPNEDYVVVCAGASTLNKCWPADRFASVIDYFTDQGVNVVLSGARDDIKLTEKALGFAKESATIINLAGETSFDEWVSVLQHARLVVANESGAIHLAAACATPTVCIAAQTYGDKWLPYRPEVVREDDCLPIVVRGDQLPCFFCKTNVTYGDPECKKCVMENGVIKCVWDVRLDTVLAAIKHCGY